jgi:hypothetical protein
MIRQSYLLDRRQPPSTLKTFVNRHAIPAAIDAAGSIEAELERLAQATRRQPLMALSLAFGSAYLFALWRGRRSAPTGSVVR